MMDLSLSAGWDELCDFLGRAVPQVSFPHANRREPPFSLKSLRWRLRYAWRRFRADGDLPPRVVPHPMLVPAPVEGP